MPGTDASYDLRTSDTPEGLKQELETLRRQAAAVEARYQDNGRLPRGVVEVDPVASFLHEQRAQADKHLSDASLVLEKTHAEYLDAQHRLQSAKTFAIAIEDACCAYMAAMQRMPDDPSA